MKKPFFSASRLVFVADPGKSNPAPEAAPSLPDAISQPEKPASMQELNKKAQEAIAVAMAEKENIEKRYGKAGSTGELPDPTPSVIKEQYEKLTETIKKLQASIGKQRQIVEDSLKAFDQITTDLDAFAAKAKQYSASGDPLYALPFERASKPTKETAQKASASKPAAAPKAAKAPAKKETRDAAEARILQEFCKRFAEGHNDVTEEEARLFSKILKPGDFTIVDMTDGKSVQLELSNDKKWVRVTISTPAENGSAKETFTNVLPLNKDEASKAEFALKTENEVTKAKEIETKGDARANLDWLQSDAAPVGSSVLLTTGTVSRKNFDSGKTEQFVQSLIARKGVNGLRLATMEYPVDENLKAIGPIKEVKSDNNFTMEKALTMVSDQVTRQIPAGEKERVAELRTGLKKLNDTVLGEMMVKGEGSNEFNKSLRDFNRLLTRFNITKWNYTDPIFKLNTKVVEGKLTIYDSQKPNPGFKDEKQTPDQPKYAVKQGPIDMTKYV